MHVLSLENALTSNSHVWVSRKDLEYLMKRGLAVATARLLTSGVVGLWGSTKVYVDNLLEEGFVRVLDGRILRVQSRVAACD